MKKELSKIVDRVEKRKAIGLIYNMPKSEASNLCTELDNKHISLDGKFAGDIKTLLFRLGYQLKRKNLAYEMLPALLDDRMITVYNADFIGPSYSQVFETMSQNKIPILLLFKNGVVMQRVRKFPAYKQLFTIEQDFSMLK